MLIPWRSYGAKASATYEVVTTQVLYLPAEPFHITDVCYPDRSNFETRTVIIYQPYRDGRPLHNRPVVFFVHGGGWVDGYADWYTDTLTPVLTAQQGWGVVNVDYRLTSDQVFLADEHCPTYDTCDPANAVKAAWYDSGYTHVTEMAAITDSRETVTQFIVEYIEMHTRKTIYLPLIMRGRAR